MRFSVKTVFSFFLNFTFATGINYNQLYLHSLGNDVFDIYGGTLTYLKSLARFGKSRKIRRQLNENAVILDRTDNTRNRLPDTELSGVFLPRSEQLLVRNVNSARFVIDAFNYRFNAAADRKAVLGVSDA